MIDLLKKTQELCQTYGIKPAHSKGQNFLIEEDVYDKVVEAAEINKNDTVLEVGPGLGFLTARLADRAKQVVAVEIDEKLADFLKMAMISQKISNVAIVNEDVTKLSLNLGSSTKYKIAANLPYNITSFFLRKFLTSEHRPVLMSLLIQKEVAERIVAKPGDMNLLALSVQFYAEPEIIADVPPKSFWPAPKVDSAIIRIRSLDEQQTETRGLSGIDEKKFFRLAKFGFSAKRKMLKNNLAAGFHVPVADAQAKIEQVGLDGRVRAEDLSLAQWLVLYRLWFV
ncbi:ribosomal RNA small subunit methyltransferase A [Candidatus Falkowbacteria bacterium]|nr:ribosomal RNA small subunit methyltransferase A [Candidatus Falkowbacteria bacterium]